jgi:peptide/nickel transport system substrate-binding protein
MSQNEVVSRNLLSQVAVNRRTFMGGVALGVASIVVLGGQHSTVAQDDEELVFVYAALKEPGNIDPGVAVDGQAYRIINNVYESLVDHVPGTFELEPVLAESYEVSEDGLTYTFHLRQGVTFTDGTPFDAEAAKFSFDRVISLAQSPASYLTNVASVDAIDDATLAITLTAPNGFFPQYVAQIPIVSPTAVQEHEVDGDQATGWLASNAVGTGPYILERWDPAEQFVLVKNADYWGGWGEGSFDRVIIRTVPEVATMRQLLEAGDVHFIDTVAPSDIEALSGNESISVVFSPPVTVNHLTMNTAKGVTQDPLIRQALSAAFPYEKVKTLVYNDFAELATGPLGEGLPGHVEGEGITQDLELAKSLLAEAGYPDGGFSLTFAFPEDQTTQQIGVVFQEELRGLGIDLQLQMVPWTQLVELMSDPEQAAELSFLIMTPVTGDPVFVLGQNFLGANAGGSWNWSYYQNPAVDEALAVAGAATSEEEVAAALDEAVALILADYPTIYATSPTQAVAMRSDVAGYVFIPTDYSYSIDLHSMSFTS